MVAAGFAGTLRGLRNVLRTGPQGATPVFARFRPEVWRNATCAGRDECTSSFEQAIQTRRIGEFEPAERAIRAAMIEPLTDEPDVRQALLRVAEITLG